MEMTRPQAGTLGSKARLHLGGCDNRDGSKNDPGDQVALEHVFPLRELDLAKLMSYVLGSAEPRRA